MDLTRKFKLTEIEALKNHCYHPGQHVTPEWEGTVFDVLVLPKYPAEDLISVAYLMLKDSSIPIALMLWVLSDLKKFMICGGSTLKKEQLSAAAFNCSYSINKFMQTLDVMDLTLALVMHQYCYVLKFNKPSSKIIGKWQIRKFRQFIKKAGLIPG